MAKSKKKSPKKSLKQTASRFAPVACWIDDDGTGKGKLVHLSWDVILERLRSMNSPYTNHNDPKFDVCDQYIGNTYKRLMDKYFDTLIEKGLSGDSIDILLDDNIIDVSRWWNFHSKSPMPGHEDRVVMLRDELLHLNERDVFLDTIPCFPTGIIKISNIEYAQWKVTNLDADKMSYELDLACYQIGGATERLHRIMHGSFKVDSVKRIFRPEKPYYEYSSAYSLIPLNEFIKLPEEREFWKQGPVRTAKLVDQRKAAEHRGSSYLDMFADSFFATIMLLNQLLKHTSPKVTHKRTSGKSAKCEVNLETLPSRKIRKVRVFDDIEITSVKVPHAINEETVRTYRVASWYTRGCLRRLKSGKVVPVRASIHHRRVLKDDQEKLEPAKVTYVVD